MRKPPEGFEVYQEYGGQPQRQTRAGTHLGRWYVRYVPASERALFSERNGYVHRIPLGRGRRVLVRRSHRTFLRRRRPAA